MGATTQPLRTLDGLPDVVGLLERVLVNLTAIELFLDELVTTEETPAATRKAKHDEVIRDQAGVIKKNWEDLGTRMAAIEEAMDSPAPDLTRHLGDLGRISNAWQHVASRDVTKLSAANDDIDLGPLRGLVEDYRTLRRKVGRFTIPLKISSLLEPRWVGSSLDINESFRDVLDTEADRKDLLSILIGMRPALLGGVVDVPAGRIYRVGGEWSRVRTFLYLVGILLAGFLLLYVLNRNATGIGPVDAAFLDTESHPVPFEKLWQPYAWLAAGVVAHIAKQAWTLARAAQGAAESPTPGLIFLWIHVRQWQFAVAAALAIGGFVLLVIAGKATPVTAFFAGYTIDSAADLIASRYRTAITSQSAAAATLLKAAAS
jgi:hypothetical protein